MQELGNLEIGRQFRYRPQKNWNFSVIGLDSETLSNGDTFLVADSLGNYIWKPVLRQYLDFLFLRPHHQKLNFFFNLEFDVSGVIKMLSEKEIKELVTAGETVLKRGIDKHGKPGSSYVLRYCKDRIYVVQLKESGHKTVAFYDIAQFYRPLSLDKAAKMFLGARKIDVQKLTGLKFKELTSESVEKHKKIFIEYCKRDCILTAKLGELTKEKYEKLGLYEKTYISPAFLSEKYFQKYCYVPKTISLLEQTWQGKGSPVEYAYNSYAGGWIEIQKRGHFENLYKYDIRSAYPSIMKNLIDPTLGAWRYSQEWLNGSDYAFVKVKVSIDPERSKINYNSDPFGTDPLCLSPISYLFSHNGTPLRYYPIGEWTTYLSKNEYLFVRDILGQRGLGVVKVVDGWFYFLPDPFQPRPLKKRIDFLYDLKTRLGEEQKKDSKLRIEYNQVKLLLNCLYGKFIQRTEVKKLDDNDNIYIDHYRTGNFFNPIWAAIITSECRLQIARALYNKEYSCAAVTTDGVLTTEPLNLEFGKGIGQWSEEPGGETVLVLPGAYGIKGLKPESKTRAFKGIFRGDISKNWFDYLTLHKDESFINVIDRRPIHIMEALLHTKKFTIGNINHFEDFAKEYNLKEYRRRWDGNISTCKDLLNKNINSSPWTVSKLEALSAYKKTRPLDFNKIDEPDSIIQRVIKAGGIKDSSALRDFGSPTEIPLCVRRREGLAFDEMSDELCMSDNELWEGLTLAR